LSNTASQSHDGQNDLELTRPMKTLTLRTRIGTDGTMDLHVPSDLPPGDAEVVVVVEPVGTRRPQPGPSFPSDRGVPTRDATIGRPISRAEALRISSQVLELAERERMEFAEWDAQPGIQWEEQE
jgi:hypothetical protein